MSWTEVVNNVILTAMACATIIVCIWKIVDYFKSTWGNE